MNIKESFKKLKNPIAWLHYFLGGITIVIIFGYLMSINVITADSGFITYLLWFIAVYIPVDRLSHGILEYD